MDNWSTWLQREKVRWDPQGKAPQTHVPEMQIPVPYPLRQSQTAQHSTIPTEDSAPTTLEDSLEYLTHNSGLYGSFTKKQRLELVNKTLLNE